MFEPVIAPSGTLLGLLQRGRGDGTLHALAAPRAEALAALNHCVLRDPRHDWQVENRSLYYARLYLDLARRARARSSGTSSTPTTTSTTDEATDRASRCGPRATSPRTARDDALDAAAPVRRRPAPTGPGPSTSWPCATTTRGCAPSPHPSSPASPPRRRARPNWPPPSATPSNPGPGGCGPTIAARRSARACAPPGAGLLRPLAAPDATERAPARLERPGRLRLGRSRASSAARRLHVPAARCLSAVAGPEDRPAILAAAADRGRRRPLHRPALPRRVTDPDVLDLIEAAVERRLATVAEAAVAAFERMCGHDAVDRARGWVHRPDALGAAAAAHAGLPRRRRGRRPGPRRPARDRTRRRARRADCCGPSSTAPAASASPAPHPSCATSTARPPPPTCAAAPPAPSPPPTPPSPPASPSNASGTARRPPARSPPGTPRRVTPASRRGSPAAPPTRPRRPRSRRPCAAGSSPGVRGVAVCPAGGSAGCGSAAAGPLGLRPRPRASNAGGAGFGRPGCAGAWSVGSVRGAAPGCLLGSRTEPDLTSSARVARSSCGDNPARPHSPPPRLRASGAWAWGGVAQESPRRTSAQPGPGFAAGAQCASRGDAPERPRPHTPPSPRQGAKAKPSPAGD